MGHRGGTHLCFGQMEHSISAVALIICRDGSREALCGITSVLPRVWEAYILEVLGEEACFMLTQFQPARGGLSFPPQLLGSHG